MKIDITTELVKFIIGDTYKVTRLTFPEIMELFNDVHEVGEKDTSIGEHTDRMLLIKGKEVPNVYGNRKKYAEIKLYSINDSIKIEELFENIVNFKANISQEDLIKEFKKFIPKNYEFTLEGEKYVLIGGESKQKLETKVEVLFDRDIKPALIKELQEAKFLIWIVMYQFRDDDLFREVLKKHKEGINIQIITSDQNTKFNFKQYGIEHYTVSTVHYTDIFKKTMHDKICIIDLERTISGSYNWTYPAATENYETVTPISSVEITKQFATKFMALKTKVIKDAKLSE